jgi:hypothetical protein
VSTPLRAFPCLNKNVMLLQQQTLCASRTEKRRLQRGVCADTFIQKTKKLYLDSRTQRNISKLQSDVQEVTSIMTKNIQEILGQGEKMTGAVLHSLRLTGSIGTTFHSGGSTVLVLLPQSGCAVVCCMSLPTNMLVSNSSPDWAQCHDSCVSMGGSAQEMRLSELRGGIKEL